MSDERGYAPAAQRNRQPILEVLQHMIPAIPNAGPILEVASGTGEHAVHFASGLPEWQWQPTDADPSALRSIAAWCDSVRLPNLSAPLALDATAETWPVERASAVVNINMIHISPWTVCQGLVAGAARTLIEDGLLFLYGPYKRDGVHTAPSNEAFDARLRKTDPEWGVRALEDVTALAERSGLSRVHVVPMPANNLSVVFRRH